MTLSERNAWTAKLRSGDVEQGEAALKFCGAYCCLGVFLSIQPQEEIDKVVGGRGLGKTWGAGYLPEGYKDLPQATQWHLADMNDGGKTFPQIADWIDGNVETED